MHSLEQHVQAMKDVVKSIENDFTKPDDDWDGMMVMLGESSFDLLPLRFRNEWEKEIWANTIIPLVIAESKPIMVGQVQSAWVVEAKAKPGATPENAKSYKDIIGVQPSQHPDRQEVVILAMITAEQYQIWTAKIVRFKDRPPKLNPWRLWPTKGDVKISGQFFEPIQKALKEVNS